MSKFCSECLVWYDPTIPSDWSSAHKCKPRNGGVGMKLMTAEEWWANSPSGSTFTGELKAYGDYIKQAYETHYDCKKYDEVLAELRYIKENIKIEEKPKTYTWEEVPVGNEFTTEGAGRRFLKLSDNSYLDTGNNVVWHSLWGLTTITAHKPVEWGKE